MWAVKLCTNKILQFLTQVDLYNGRKTVVAVAALALDQVTVDSA